MKQVVKNLVQYIVSWACRSRFLSHILFGIHFKRVGGDDYYFDITTPVLVKKALESLVPDSRVLDMGTGSSCVIGLSLWKKVGCKVTASDINPEIIALARENIKHNRASVKLINSRFFDNINETFDIIIFNPPYVPTAKGKIRNLPDERRSQWDGGEEGTKVIETFLKELARLNYPLTALVGVNSWHVPKEKILELIKNQDSLSVEEIYRHFLLPVNVYTLRKELLNKKE